MLLHINTEKQTMIRFMASRSRARWRGKELLKVGDP
jgi:hypothetical protein